MEFVCYDSLDKLPESASTLFVQAATESLFFSQPWYENLLENGCNEGQAPLIACVLDGEHVLAILPLSHHGGGQYHSLKHLYTSLSTLLIVENPQPAILTCLARGLRDLSVQSLQLDPVAEDDKNLHKLQLAMESEGFSTERYYRFRNWIHRVEDETYTEYMAARPSRVRNTIARKRRKLEREHGYHIRLYTDKDLQQGISDYRAVYTASWKANEVFEPFVQGLAEHLSRSGWLRLAVLYIDSQPAAAQFWFVAHGKASIFKLAYDEAWKQYSPGSILIAYLMEHVIDTDKVDEIDFLTGNDSYKQDWMSERRDRYRLCFIKTSPINNEGIWFHTPLRDLLKWLNDRVYNPLFRQKKEANNATDT